MPIIEDQRKLIVLVGAGQANIEILRQHVRRPFENCDVLLVTPRPTKFLRNMLPWVISGELRRQHAEIDLLKLCRISNTQIILSEVTHFDLSVRSAFLANGAQIYFDYLSISVGCGIGTQLEGPHIVNGNQLESIVDRLENLLSSPSKVPEIGIYGDSPLSALIIRGLARLKTQFTLTLLTKQNECFQQMSRLDRMRLHVLLKKMRAKITCGDQPEKAIDRGVLLKSGQSVSMDLLILADEGNLSGVFSRSGMPLTDNLVCVNDALQLKGSRSVFVAGPGVSVQGHLVKFNPHRPSQRFGKIIGENIRRDLKNKPLVVFRGEHSMASWLPGSSGPFSLRLQKLKNQKWRSWLDRQKLRSKNNYLCSSSGEVLRSSAQNTALSLVTSQAKLNDLEPQWVAQVMGRKIIHQSEIKRAGRPQALLAHVQLDEAQSAKLMKSKVSQVKAGLEALHNSAVEVRVSSGIDESIHLSSEVTFQANLSLKAGDYIYLIGKLGSVQSLFDSMDEKSAGENWFRLRSEFNQDHTSFIKQAQMLGAVDGCVLDERGFVRSLEDLVEPNNLGVSLDLDRVPVYSVQQSMAVNRSSHVLQNMEYAKYLPREREMLLQHPRFLALFGSEISGMVMIFPKAKATEIASELAARFPQVLLSPVGALTEGPVRFQFRLTTR